MTDIIFCELCGEEVKNDIIEMRGRIINVCPSCANLYITQLDKACSDAWDTEIAKIKATQTIDATKQIVIQTKIDKLNAQKLSISEVKLVK